MRSETPVMLVTGASGGIGAALARAAGPTHRLVLAARRAIEPAGDAVSVPCDVREWDDVRRACGAAVDRFGRLDVVVANAGVSGPGAFASGPMDPTAWQEMVLTNVYGAALTIRATMAALKDSRGHLLLTGSVAGRRALPGSLYSATKWAVTAMGEAARQDFNDTGVRVTLIEPGMVDTPFFDSPPSIEALKAEDVARGVMYAVSQPRHVDVNEILIRPTAQPG